MNRSIAHALLGIAVVALLVACQSNRALPGAATITPNSQDDAVQRFSLKAAPDPIIGLNCGVKVKPLPIPGTYTSFDITGTRTGNTFVSTAKVSYWVSLRLVHATPPPSPTPAPTPSSGTTPTPTMSPWPKEPQYIYYGSFKLDKGTRGCVFLDTTVSGKPLPLQSHNSEINSVILTKGWSHITFVKQGPAEITVRNLGPNGGNGTIVLTNANGSPFDSGTVTLVKRTRVDIP